MDLGEEQSNELEALEAIYDADFRIAEPPSKRSGARFEIELDDVAQDVKLRLVFTHSLDYPDSPLELVVYALSGLSTHRRQDLQSFLEKIAQDNVGIPCAYTLCQSAQEWVEENITGAVEDDRGNESDENSKFETLDATLVDKVEVISSKAIGTPVTVESFSGWREKFTEELESQRTKEELEMQSSKKITGREFFENKTVVVSAESESFWEQEVDQMTGAS